MGDVTATLTPRRQGDREDGVSNHATLTGDVLKPRDVLRAFRRQMLQVAIGVSQEFRQDVNREIKRNVREPDACAFRLIRNS